MKLAVVFLLFILSGCQIVYYPDTYKSESITCNPMLLPMTPPTPSVPVIPDNRVNDKNFTDTALINKIDELRKYAAAIKEDFYNAYRDHIKSCR